VQAGSQRPHADGFGRRDVLGGGEALAVLLEALGAEELSADQLG
jgi:hypothetical protein